MPIVSPAAYSFNSAFAKYGETPDTIGQEIKDGLLQAILTDVTSQDFGRGIGVGIESLENEQASFIQFILYRAQVVAGVARYNVGAPESHQVVTSQDLVDVYTEDAGQFILKVNLRYLELRSLITPEPDLQSLLIPVVA